MVLKCEFIPAEDISWKSQMFINSFSCCVSISKRKISIVVLFLLFSFPFPNNWSIQKKSVSTEEQKRKTEIQIINGMRMQNDIPMKMMRNIIPFIIIWCGFEFGNIEHIIVFIMLFMILSLSKTFANIWMLLHYLLLFFSLPLLMLIDCVVVAFIDIFIFSYFSWESKIKNEMEKRVKLRIPCKWLNGTRQFMKPIHHQSNQNKRDKNKKNLE